MKTSELRKIVRQVIAEEETDDPEIIQICRRIVKNQQLKWYF